MSTRDKVIGLFESLGRAIGGAAEAMLSDEQREQVRASYAARFGVCRKCHEPLGGESPSQICTDCHAAEVLAVGLGGANDSGPAA